MYSDILPIRTQRNVSRATLVLTFYVKVAISGDCGMEGDIPRTRGQTHEQRGQTHWTVKVSSESETKSSWR